jgi:hypothetical protein
MKTAKHILALVLTLCLLTSIMLPTVWAEENNPAIYVFGSSDGKNYEFNSKSANSGYTKLDSNAAHTFTPEGTAAWTYLNQSHTTRRVQVTPTYTKIGFSGSDKTNYPFVAVQLENVTAGTYNLNFKLTLTDSGGLAKIYIVTREAYNTAIQTWLEKYDTQDSAIVNKQFATLADEHTTIYNALNDRALNNLENSVLSCYNYEGASAEQSIGKVTFGANGNYVLVIQSNGKDTRNSNDYRNVQINSLTLVPPAAKIGDTEYFTVQAAVDAAEAEGKTVTLLRNVTENAVDVKSGVTLDLNGKTLTADVIGQGKLTDSSAAAGVVISDEAPTCGVNADELLLKTTVGYQIFDYTLTAAEPVKAEDGKSVKFWFDVRFAEAQATAAYTAIAAGDSGFKLTVDLSWENGSALPVRFGDGKSVADWASLMLQKPEYSFYICVEGLDSVTTAGTLKAAPKIDGLQGSSTVEMAYDITVQ